MKKLLRFTILFITCLGGYVNVNAKHIAGGELTYVWLHDSTYHFTFKLYRDCLYLSSSNINEPSWNMCYKSSCSSSSYPTLQLNEIPALPNGNANCSPVSTGCAGYPTTCQSLTSALAGYQECWYEGDLTLPYQCSKWTFSVYASSRNADDNLSGGTGNELYVEATLNNVIAQGNSSANYTVEPVPFVCINSPYTYNNGAVDINNDSLGFALRQPQTSGGDCDPSSNIPFINASYNLTNNPLATGNTFVLSPTTGEMQFTPNAQGKYNLTLVVTEYRNHVAIGTTMRDIQIYVSGICSIPPPPFVPDTVNISGGHLDNGIIENCANTPLNFCFKSKSANSGAVLVISDNHTQVAPGGTVSYTGELTDSVIGCFSWIPSNADTGLKILTVTIKDSTCTAGISIAQTFTIPIYVHPNTYTNNDTSICLGNSVNLMAHGGADFTWSVLAGGSPLGSLSCTNCANPVATPTVSTTYVVTSNQSTSNSCNNTDTVKVTVNAIPAAPNATSNGPLCANTALDLFAGTTASAYVWTGPAGFNSVIQDPVIANIQVPNTGMYYVRAKNGGCISALDSVYVSVSAAPKFPTITGNSPQCIGGTLNLLAQSNAGVNYLWTGPNNFSSTAQNVVIPNVGTQYAGTYTVTAHYPGSSACTSAAASYAVVISPGVFSDFQFSKDTICKDDVIAISYSATGDTGITWNFNGGVPQSSLSGNPIQVLFPVSGQETITLSAASSACTADISHVLHVFSAPPNTFSVPPVACLGDVINVVDNNEYDQDAKFTWNFGTAVVTSGSGDGPYTLHYTQPGNYVITLITQNTYCTSPPNSDTVFVDPVPNASITTSNIDNICSDDSVEFKGADISGYRYQWRQPIYFINDTLSSTVALVRYNGYISLNVTDQYGCKASDSLFLTTHPCCNVYFPNAFTPNHDGRNDMFRPITVGHHDIAYFRVFNRWGELVYSSRIENEGWNGTFNGVPADAGNYFYTIKYRCVDGVYYEQKGEVVLVR